MVGHGGEDGGIRVESLDEVTRVEKRDDETVERKDGGRWRRR